LAISGKRTPVRKASKFNFQTDQHSKFRQIPGFKSQVGLATLEAWNLILPWILDVDAWIFPLHAPFQL
jgi:hypothetical protein